jgi:hypothetical protein
MPDQIRTAQIVAVDPETLEVNSLFPGTYGFYVRLSCDPGPEWAAELEEIYNNSVRTSKPPLIFRGDTLCVFYLPTYIAELPQYLEFLTEVLAQVNLAIERRNAVLPDDTQARESFRAELRALAGAYQQKR